MPEAKDISDTEAVRHDFAASKRSAPTALAGLPSIVTLTEAVGIMRVRVQTTWPTRSSPEPAAGPAKSLERSTVTWLSA